MLRTESHKTDNKFHRTLFDAWYFPRILLSLVTARLASVASSCFSRRHSQERRTVIGIADSGLGYTL